MGFGNRQTSDGDSVQILPIIAAPSGERTSTLGIPASDAPVSGAALPGRATARGAPPRVTDAPESSLMRAIPPAPFPPRQKSLSSLLNSDVGWACRRVYLPSTGFSPNHPFPSTPVWPCSPKDRRATRESTIPAHPSSCQGSSRLLGLPRLSWHGSAAASGRRLTPMLSGSAGGERQGSWGPR